LPDCAGNCASIAALLDLYQKGKSVNPYQAIGYLPILESRLDDHGDTRDGLVEQVGKLAPDYLERFNFRELGHAGQNIPA
jgi:hypothetical protein